MMALSWLGVVFPLVLWLVMGFSLYVIIRFGVKHGMRSYYAEAADRSIITDGIIGAESEGPIDGPSEGSTGDPTR